MLSGPIDIYRLCWTRRVKRNKRIKIIQISIITSIEFRHYHGLLIKNSNFMSSNLVRPHRYIVCLCGQEEPRETKGLKIIQISSIL
jgi:hypothetical protein